VLTWQLHKRRYSLPDFNSPFYAERVVDGGHAHIVYVTFLVNLLGGIRRPEILVAVRPFKLNPCWIDREGMLARN
jgi:hypothetical protein